MTTVTPVAKWQRIVRKRALSIPSLVGSGSEDGADGSCHGSTVVGGLEDRRVAGAVATV